MKTILISGITVLLLTMSVAAQTPSTSSAANTAAPTANPAAKELVALDQFLNLSDAELAQMEQVIARVRAMTPAQRTALRDEIATFRKLPEPQRQQLRQGWGGMPVEIQNGWREMMQRVTPEKRAEIQAKLQSLPPEEKMHYRQELVEAYLKTKASQK